MEQWSVALPELHALKSRRQKSGAPLLRAADRVAIVEHDDERGQVAVGAAQTVIHPSTQRGTTAQDRAAVHFRHTAEVVDAVGPAGADHGHLIDVLRDVRIPVRHPDSTLPMLLEGSLGW